jgi:NADP-dependent 3-hydroxy acid dehydrogenase YdfG
MLFPQNGKIPHVGPFRAVNNMGDFLGRVNYSCGGPNTQNASKPGYSRLIRNVPQQCDPTGITVTTCNPKFVSDSSDYIRFRKLRAMNQTYNDLSYGGDKNNASFVSLMAVRRR